MCHRCSALSSTRLGSPSQCSTHTHTRTSVRTTAHQRTIRHLDWSNGSLSGGVPPPVRLADVPLWVPPTTTKHAIALTDTNSHDTRNARTDRERRRRRCRVNNVNQRSRSLPGVAERGKCCTLRSALPIADCIQVMGYIISVSVAACARMNVVGYYTI